MGQDEAKKVSVDEVLSLIDRLTPAQWEQLRNKLNDRAWKQRLQQFANSDFTRNASETWRWMIERLGSGNIDEDIKQASAKAWQDFIDRLGAMYDALNSGTQSGSSYGFNEDPEMQLEMAYQELQTNLIQVRQAVAQAIATEKQLEQQLQKNKDQAAIWQNRAAMAIQQNNNDLAGQAMQRNQQYAQAAAGLDVQLKAQKEATGTLRQRLTELEGKVQKVYTQKQVLVARDKAAQATAKANEILSRMNTEEAVSVLGRMEQRVVERESAASVSAATIDRTQLDSEQILIKAIAALENATAVIERMELLVLMRDNEGKSSPDTETGTIKGGT